MSNQLVKEPIQLVHIVNPNDNGGEQCYIITKIGEDENNVNTINSQEIHLNSYCNSVQLNLFTAILTPEFLRKMADDIEANLIHLRNS